MVGDNVLNCFLEACLDNFSAYLTIKLLLQALKLASLQLLDRIRPYHTLTIQRLRKLITLNDVHVQAHTLAHLTCLVLMSFGLVHLDADLTKIGRAAHHGVHVATQSFLLSRHFSCLQSPITMLLLGLKESLQRWE